MLVNKNSLNRPCFAYDHQDEYGEYYYTDIAGVRTKVKGVGLPKYRKGLLRSRFTGKPSEFIKIASEMKFTNLLFDEATIYLKGSMPDDIRDIVASKFHTQNNIFFVFHSFELIPPDLMRLTDHIIAFKTHDTLKKVQKRFDQEIVTAGFLKQFNKPDKIKDAKGKLVAPGPVWIDRNNERIDNIEYKQPKENKLF